MKKLNVNGIDKVKKFLGIDLCIESNSINLNIEDIAKLAKIGIITESNGNGSYWCYNANIITEDLDEIDDERIDQDQRREDKREFEELVTRLSEIFPTKSEIEDVLNQLKDNMVLKSELSDVLQ